MRPRLYRENEARYTTYLKLFISNSISAIVFSDIKARVDQRPVRRPKLVPRVITARPAPSFRSSIPASPDLGQIERISQINKNVLNVQENTSAQAAKERPTVFVPKDVIVPKVKLQLLSRKKVWKRFRFVVCFPPDALKTHKPDCF